MKYRIVSASSRILLEEEVMKWMEIGYVPTGGLVISTEKTFEYESNNSKLMYFQAIVKLD